MPTVAILLGVVGIIPFIFFGLGAVGQEPGSAQRMLVALIDYAALLLTFAGGVQCGMGLAPMASRPAARLGAGTVPLVLAWIALILAQIVSPVVAVVLLLAGYLGMVLIEHRMSQQWSIPRNHMLLRWMISIVGMVTMILVLVLRGLGQTIVF